MDEETKYSIKHLSVLKRELFNKRYSNDKKSRESQTPNSKDRDPNVHQTFDRLSELLKVTLEEDDEFHERKSRLRESRLKDVTRVVPHIKLSLAPHVESSNLQTPSLFSRLSKSISKYFHNLHPHALFVEALSCMIFHFVGSVSPTPWSNGIILTVLVYYCAKISGAHLNPAVSWTFCLLGHIDPIHFIAYATSQFIGCILGAILIALLVPQLSFGREPSGPFENRSGCFTPAVSTVLVFVWETLGTTSFILPIFSVVWYTQNKKGYGNTGPLIVGLSLIANAMACSSFTGGALNPARMASQVVFSCPYKAVYSYILGEFLGATIAALIISPFYGVSHDPWYKSLLTIPMFSESIDNDNEKGVDDTFDARNSPIEV